MSLRKLLGCFSFAVFLSHVYAQTESTSTQTASFNSPIKASDYCKFLNHVAACDPDHLFDQKMATDPEAACIVRLGTPGKYFYEVIAGRENFPICYVNAVDENSYCNETGDIISNDDKNDGSLLKSNLSSFAVDIPSLPTLTLGLLNSSRKNAKLRRQEFLMTLAWDAFHAMQNRAANS